MKSAALGTNNALNATLGHVVLCTDEETFSVRQVQSSNSVFLIQPPDNTLPSNDDSMDKGNVRAIAQCTSTLELIPTLAMGASVLRQFLPIFRSSAADPRNENELAKDYNAMEKFNKHKALQDLPLSFREFDEAWLEVCAFELGGQAWLPSAKSLKSVWNSTLSAAAMKDVNLTEKFRVLDLKDIMEEDGIPHALFNAVLERVCIDNETLMDGCMWTCALPYCLMDLVDE